MGRTNRHLGEAVAGSTQSALCRCDNVTCLDIHVGTQGLQAVDEQINGTGADGAATGKRYACLMHSGKQGANDPETGTHARDQLIGRGGIDDFARPEMNRAALAAILAEPLALDLVVDAMIGEDANEGFNVCQMWQIVQNELVAGQERCDHQGQRSILGA